MDGVLSSPKKKIMLQFVPCLILMVAATNARIKGNFKCTGPKVITCRKGDIPTVNSGLFNCTGLSVGEKCNLTCNDGYYPSSSKETVCEETYNSKANWSAGNFTCSEIKCFTNDVTQKMNEPLLCPPEPFILKGGMCNFTCEQGFYPFPSNRRVCKAGNGANGGEWFGGFCRQIDCSQWNEWRGKEYKFISTKQTWEGSRLLCENDGAHLVTIENEQGNDFVHKVVSHCVVHDNYISIGLNDLENEGQYKWNNGTDVEYYNWDGGEPTRSDSEDCGCIKLSNKKWHDYPCSRSYSAVCEKGQDPK